MTYGTVTSAYIVHFGLHWFSNITFCYCMAFSAVFIAYKHYTRKKSEEVEKIKSYEKFNENNMEEVSLKALEKPKESIGKIIYSLRYIKESFTLKVLIKSAHDLLAMDSGGTSDPYVKLWLREAPKNKFETKVKKRTLNPIFDEEFSFMVSEEDLPNQFLVFSVFDFDRFSKHDQIGCLFINLGKLDFSKTVDDWAELDPPNSDADTEIPLGEICISLRYNPDEEILNIKIVEAKNLKKHPDEEYYDPFIKLLLMEGGKRLKKKYSTVKKTTPNPYFNEEFNFQLSQALLTKVQLIIIVLNCDGNTKHNMPIGNVIMGQTVTGSGLKHWKEMVACPKRPVAHWHTLVNIIDIQQK